MDRRRALSQRPASSEEIQCWSHSSNALSAFTEIYNNPAVGDAIARVNRLIAGWSTGNGDDALPLDGFDTARSVYRKLNSGLNEVKSMAEVEAKAIDEALENISVLIALRKAPETISTQDKRKQRPRGSSPSSLPSTPPVVPPNRVTLNNKDRASEGPTSVSSNKKDNRARSKLYAKQVPYREGRKVAFHPPSGTGNSKSGENGDGDENTWILAVITKCMNTEKGRYQVQDAEPQEDGQPGQVYTANSRDIIPLPDPEAPPLSPSHINAYPEFSTGSQVLALYPDTSCLYKAKVMQGPRDTQNTRTGQPSKQATVYRLQFEDDGDQIHSVQAQWVVEWPGPS